MAAVENDTADTPEWLNREFVAEVIQSEEVQPVNILRTTVTRAVGTGENYGSLLLRVGVDYMVVNKVSELSTLTTTSLIVKCLPMGEMYQQILRESGAFERETKMYTTTIPKLEVILNEGTKGVKINFGPKMYPVDHPHTIVLQDLCQNGFRMVDRKVGMDLAHATLVLRKLASYHAASVELHARDPEYVESYTEPLYVPEKRDQLSFVPQALGAIAKVVEPWEKEDPEKFAGYADKVRSFTLTAFDQIFEAAKPSQNFLNVLNHGDCWINNCLFQYDEDNGKLQDMRFIDFQLPRYASPTLDLQYLLYTSVQADVREAHWDLLLNTYISQLRATLEALGHGEEAKKITQKTLEEEMKTRASFGLVCGCSTLCAVMADPSDAIVLDDDNLEKFEKGDSGMFEKAMSGKRFNDALKRLLPMFVANGTL